ncbi:MAG TPA: pyridoxal phosphate-dependent aminotransferase [Thermoanaerobaculia bacterium]|nr:pyridoxal phosphate-dependent aminotransferase [Thermoanaerobaculia bacterium]
MFSQRAQWSAPINQLTLERRKRGDLLDLTETNPTRASLPYPEEKLTEAMARGARASYDPDPRGLRSAREALAIGLQCDADDLILTASTSEAYSFLFKLLTDPGDVVLTATPSYPLLEHLASLELVQLRTFAMEFHRRWEIHDVPVDETTRAILVVNPNNPTGSFVSRAEQDALAAHGIPIISDEVFLDYPVEGSGTSFVRNDVLTFTLGGLSKSAGLPHFKLAWIRVSGPEAQRRAALEGLELIADNFLSVATPVQVALPELLRIAPEIRDAISRRLRRNLETLRMHMKPSAQILPVEGGWSVVVRVPRVMSDDELAMALLDRGVVVQPGYFFDFHADGYLVLSLLTREDVFAAGVAKLADIIPA